MKISRDGLFFLIGLVIIVWLAITLFGCALSLKSPTSQMVIKTATFAAGYETGKAYPEIGKEIIEKTDVDRKDLLTYFDSWQNYLAYRLVDDPVRAKLVENMLGLVQVDWEIKPSEERVEAIRELFREFIVGLQAGIDANPDR